MLEPISISAAIILLEKSAPIWLENIRNIFLDKGKELVLEQGQSRLHEYVDKKKQLRHLELALKNAAERGLSQFETLKDRDQYRHILTILSEPGSLNDTLRIEAMRLFTLSDSPHLEELKEIYNRSLRIRSLTQEKPPDEVDTTIFLNSFFDALISELYMDQLFHRQMSDVLKVGTGISMQRSLKDVVVTLHQIGETITPTYKTEQFEQDVQIYATYLERTFRYHKLVGIVPQGRKDENGDPELNGIFVPLRITPLNQISSKKPTSNFLVPLIEQVSFLVLLGGPGFGKSISVRYLAWCHAAANLHSSPVISSQLLSGNPLPLRIELRRFAEDRKQHPSYSFLSYTSEVLLKRENISIQTQMFRELLERKAMLLLFDGLDEVATLEERQKLIEEIEHLAMEYPGNRILVTSRPVGYDFARFSSQWFSHAQIQEFNDTQIHTFLERWYLHVLHRAPLTSDEQQELEELFTTLKVRPRLHTLAKSPLLLSVIAALHRSKRLPDRRVLVYEECTKILLEIWSQFRGTASNWSNLLMTEEDQRACIAHLGFVLHKHSQERIQQASDQSMFRVVVSKEDVSAKYLLQEIECFLEDQNLFTSIAEKRAEAKQFLKMIQMEVGIIVESGTDEDGEALYSFIHSTFQEYFAAMDVYERYQREEKASIISSFLEFYLFDSHWHEVILLLIGKLKRKPATTQLQQLFEGKIKTRCSEFTSILHQELFFVSLCLTEEISIENTLAQQVALHLSHLVCSSPFPSQRAEALEALTSLKDTRQYSELAYDALINLLKHETVDVTTKMQVAQVLFLNSSTDSKEKLQATKILMQATLSDIPFQSAEEILGHLYFRCPHDSEDQQSVGLILYQLTQRPTVTFEEALSFYQGMLYAEREDEDRPSETPLSKAALELARRTNITFEQKVEATKSLAVYTDSESEINKLAIQMLLELAQQASISLEHRGLAAMALYRCSFDNSIEKHIATQILLEIARNPRISVELVVKITKTFYNPLHGYLEKREQVIQILNEWLGRPKFAFDEFILVICAFCQITTLSSKEHVQALQKLSQLSQQPDITFEQRIAAINAFMENSALKSQERQIALNKLMTLLQQSDLTINQTLYLAQVIYRYILYAFAFDDIAQEVDDMNKHFEQAIMQSLLDLTQRPHISFDQMVSIIKFLYKEEKMQIFSERNGVVASQVVVGGYFVKSEERQLARQIILQLLQEQNLTEDQRLQLLTIPFKTAFPNFNDIAYSIKMILSIMKREVAKEYFAMHLQQITGRNGINLHDQEEIQSTSADIFYLIELAKQGVFPTNFGDGLYKLLRQRFPLYWKTEERTNDVIMNPSELY